MRPVLPRSTIISVRKIISPYVGRNTAALFLHPARCHSRVIDYTHIFSPRVLNEARFGFSRNKTFITVQDSGFDASKVFVDAAGNPLPGIVQAGSNKLDSGLPTIGISGGFAPLGSTSNLPQGRRTNTYELYDNVSWIAPFGASKHSWRMGVHIRREDARRFLDGSARGVFN